MAKAARNRAIRRRAREIDATHTKSIARALRRHGRMPILEQPGFHRPTRKQDGQHSARYLQPYRLSEDDFRRLMEQRVAEEQKRRARQERREAGRATTE